MSEFLGVGLGSATKSYMDTSKQLQDMGSQSLQDKQREQQLQLGSLRLEDERISIDQKRADMERAKRQREALDEIDRITKEVQTPKPPAPKVDPINDGDPSPGLDQGTNGLAAASGPDMSYLTDPVKFSQYQARLAPHMATALGPEKGAAFMQSVQRSVENFVPQAAMKLVGGDVVGATKLLRASPMYGPTLKGISPIVNQDGTTTHWKLDFGDKGQVAINPKEIMAAAMKPGEYLDYDLKVRGEARQDMNTETNLTQARTSETRARIDETRAQIDADKVGPQIDLLRAQADAAKATGEAATANAKSNEGLRQETANLRKEQAAAAAQGPKRNWGTINNSIASAALKNDYVMVEIPNKPGEKRPDAGRVGMVRAAAERLARKNPDFADSPADAVFAASMMLQDIEKSVEKQVEQEAVGVRAREPGLWAKGSKKGYYSSEGAKDLDDWKKKRAEYLRARAVADAGLGTAEAARAAAKAADPARASGTIRTGGATAGEIPTVSTVEEAAKLPPGTKFKIAGRDEIRERK